MSEPIKEVHYNCVIAVEGISEEKLQEIVCQCDINTIEGIERAYELIEQAGGTHWLKDFSGEDAIEGEFTNQMEITARDFGLEES